MAYSQYQLQDIAGQFANWYGIPKGLFNQTIQAESNWKSDAYNPQTTSSGNGAGIAQFMPATAKQYGVTNVYDPVQSLWGAGAYLSDLYKSGGNSWVNALKNYGAINKNSTDNNASQSALASLANTLDMGGIGLRPQNTDSSSSGLSKNQINLPDVTSSSATSESSTIGAAISDYFSRSITVIAGAIILAGGVLLLVYTSGGAALIKNAAKNKTLK